MALIAGVVAVSLLGDSMLYAVLPTRMDKLGLTMVQVGLLLSVNRLVRLLTNSLAAGLFRKLGFRVAVGGALVLAAATTASYGVVQSFTVLLGARALWGLCWSVLRLGGYLSALDVGVAHGQGRLMGMFVSVSRLGSLVGAMIGGVLADVIGFHQTALLFGGCTLLGLLGIRRGPPIPAPARELTGRSSWEEMVSPDLLPIHLAGMVNYLVGSGLVAGTAGYLLKARFGAEASVFGYAVGIASVSGVVAASRWFSVLALGPAGGRLADRIGTRRASLSAVGLCAAGAAALAVPLGLAWTVLAFFGVFAGHAVLAVALPVALSRRIAAQRRPQALAAFASWYDLGAAIGPIAGFRLMEDLGPGPVYLAGAGLLALAGLVLMLPMRPPD